MKTATVTLKSLTPYSQSRLHDTPKLEKEAPDDYEVRTWRERCHANEDGVVYIPPMALKSSVAEAATFLGQKIPGRGKSTYSKHFLAGVLVIDGPLLGVRKDDIEGEWFFMNSDGRRGSGSRVKRRYPVVRSWEATVEYHILDDTITEDVFEAHIREAGNFIGIGRFRPKNGGFYGRYTAVDISWSSGISTAA